MTQLNRVRYVSQNYRNLRGLRLVPLSIVFLISSFTMFDFLHDLTFVQGGILLPLFAILGYSAVDFWYDRRYGRTGERALEGLWHGAKHVCIHLVVGALFAVGSSLILSLVVGIDYAQPWVSARGLSIAGVYLLFRWYWAGRRLHHLFAFGVLFTMSLLPLVGVQAAQMVWFNQGYWVFTTGVLLLLTSLMDHFILTRALKPVPHEEAAHEHTL